MHNQYIPVFFFFKNSTSEVLNVIVDINIRGHKLKAKL